MKQQLRIKVERYSTRPDAPLVKMFEKVIDMDSSVSVPFGSIYNSLCFIFGFDSVVTFSLSAYGKN